MFDVKVEVISSQVHGVSTGLGHDESNDHGDHQGDDDDDDYHHDETMPATESLQFASRFQHEISAVKTAFSDFLSRWIKALPASNTTVWPDDFTKEERTRVREAITQRLMIWDIDLDSKMSDESIKDIADELLKLQSFPVEKAQTPPLLKVMQHPKSACQLLIVLSDHCTPAESRSGEE